MKIPADLSYTEKHEWVKFDGLEAVVGITDYAQQEMGDIVYISLPSVGEAFQEGDVLAEIESVKAVSYVYAPVSGTVAEVNEALNGAPEKINADAYGSWIAKLKDAKAGESLLDAAAYEKLLSEEKE